MCEANNVACEMLTSLVHPWFKNVTRLSSLMFSSMDALEISTAVIAQIVQTGYKSMKLGTITKFTKVNNLGYGVTLISPMELRIEHAPKY